MNETELVQAITSIKTEILSAVPVIAGLQSTIETLQSAVAQLEAQVAAQPAGNYSQAVVDAIAALLSAALRMHNQISPPAVSDPPPLPLLQPL